MTQAERRSPVDTTKRDERIAEFLASVFDYFQPKYCESPAEEAAVEQPVDTDNVVQLRPRRGSDDSGSIG